MAIVITGISKTDFAIYGGEEFTISAVAGANQWVLGAHYSVYLGRNGTIADALCYSGAIGNGYVCHPDSITAMRAVSPPQVRGTGYIVTVVLGALSGGFGGLRVVEQPWVDMVFDVRRHWPGWLVAGPRSIEREPRQDL